MRNMISIIKEMFYFFRDTGGKVDEFLPPVDALLIEPELGSLAASSTFQFLIDQVRIRVCISQLLIWQISCK